MMKRTDTPGKAACRKIYIAASAAERKGVWYLSTGWK